MFEKSIIVAAHPDDEILWFSSIIGKVNDILICFLELRAKPYRTLGRKKSLQEYPLKNVSCLGLEESEAFWNVNWRNPVITKFGMETANNVVSARRYEDNYYALMELLKNRLAGYKNVFTHNPWGEYGHVEHVHIYRVLKDLQKTLNFELWFSNYCSNKSFNLLLEHIMECHSKYMTFQTDKRLAAAIKTLYQKNEGWTWYADYEWFNEESFIKDNNSDNLMATDELRTYGRNFPLNFIKVARSQETSEKPRRLRSFINKVLCRNQNTTKK